MQWRVGFGATVQQPSVARHELGINGRYENNEAARMRHVPPGGIVIDKLAWTPGTGPEDGRFEPIKGLVEGPFAFITNSA